MHILHHQSIFIRIHLLSLLINVINIFSTLTKLNFILVFQILFMEFSEQYNLIIASSLSKFIQLHGCFFKKAVQSCNIQYLIPHFWKNFVSKIVGP